LFHPTRQVRHLVLVLVAAIVLLGFIAALLLAAFVLGFIAVTATGAAARADRTGK